eukprot:scaffold64698_cov35-Tisochrysis_lutea.AAC.2
MAGDTAGGGGGWGRERPGRGAEAKQRSSWSSCIYLNDSKFVVHAAISPWVTASHPNSAVKQGRAQVVLRWGTTREGWVLHVILFT